MVDEDKESTYPAVRSDHLATRVYVTIASSLIGLGGYAFSFSFFVGIYVLFIGFCFACHAYMYACDYVAEKWLE